MLTAAPQGERGRMCRASATLRSQLHRGLPQPLPAQRLVALECLLRTLHWCNHQVSSTIPLHHYPQRSLPLGNYQSLILNFPPDHIALLLKLSSHIPGLARSWVIPLAPIQCCTRATNAPAVASTPSLWAPGPLVSSRHPPPTP